MSKSRTEGGALVAIVIALGGAHAASADATAHQRVYRPPVTSTSACSRMDRRRTR